MASVFTAAADANGDGGNSGNGTGATSAADDDGDSDAEHEWWPRVLGAGDRGEVEGAAERADDANAE